MPHRVFILFGVGVAGFNSRMLYQEQHIDNLYGVIFCIRTLPDIKAGVKEKRKNKINRLPYKF